MWKRRRKKKKKKKKKMMMMEVAVWWIQVSDWRLIPSVPSLLCPYSRLSV